MNSVVCQILTYSVSRRLLRSQFVVCMPQPDGRDMRLLKLISQHLDVQLLQEKRRLHPLEDIPLVMPAHLIQAIMPGTRLLNIFGNSIYRQVSRF